MTLYVPTIRDFGANLSPYSSQKNQREQFDASL